MTNEIYLETLQVNIQIYPFLKELNGKTVLISGANGLISSTLIDLLMLMNQQGAEIKVLAICRKRQSAEERFENYISNDLFELIVQDVTESLEIVEGVDFIIHAASKSDPLSFSRYPVEVMKANLLGTIALLDYATKYKCDKFLFISSGEVYGEVDAPKGYLESMAGEINTMSVRSCYPESKRAAETLCVSYSEQYGIDVSSVRLCHVFGPMITPENSRADAQFLRNVLEGKNIVLKSMGEQIRSYCYVLDAVVAILFVLLKGENQQAYNVAGESISIRKYAEIMAEYANVELEFQLPSSEEKKGFSQRSKGILSGDKLSKMGWTARFTVEEGIMNMLDILLHKHR